MRVDELRVKLFADGAVLADMVELYRRGPIRGFTTNPTLMHKAGVRDYREFARQVVAAIPDRPISFEVLSDEVSEMEAQAREIATWGRCIYVKIPVVNSRGQASYDLIRRLSQGGIRINVTAVLTLDQVAEAAAALHGGAPSNISVFAGRIADTGRDPVPIMADAVKMLRSATQIELIWASPRELLNVIQADMIGCDIITVTGEILSKLELLGKDLGELSLDTVRMFSGAARAAGLTL
jgi:transaldolase